MTLPITTDTIYEYFKTVDPCIAERFYAATKSEKPLVILKPLKEREYFARITRAIVGQQISTHAARAVYTRLLDICGGDVTPQRVHGLSATDLRSVGLSLQKARYIQHNAETWHALRTRDFKTMTDDEVIRSLTELYGVGRWTAEMFLMFSLGRADVFSYGDLGLMQAIYSLYGYKKHWNRKIETTVNTWSPYRTYAALTLWHYKDNTPLRK